MVLSLSRLAFPFLVRRWAFSDHSDTLPVLDNTLERLLFLFLHTHLALAAAVFELLDRLVLLLARLASFVVYRLLLCRCHLRARFGG